MSVNDHIILTGDFNIDFLKPIPTNWESTLSCYNLIQLVCEPTRVTSKSVTLIDHIYSTKPEAIINVSVPSYCPSDHYPVSFTINKHNQNGGTASQKHIFIKYRNFKRFDDEQFLSDLKKENFNDIYALSDPDAALDLWYSKFKRIFDKHAPMVFKRVRKKFQSKWLNKEIAQLRSKRNFFHQRKDFVNYKFYRNKLTSKLRESKSDYFSHAIASGKRTSELWKHLKDVKSETKHQISRIKFDRYEISDQEEICEHFNTHFSSVAASIIKNPKTSFYSPKLQEFVDKNVGNAEFAFLSLTPYDVYSELLKLDINKSTGLDDVGPNILKISAPVIFESLAHIYNLSLCSGYFPSKFKYARVTPVYKAGDVLDMNNYRPISVLPTLSKLFEKFVYSQLYEYLLKHNLIYKNQSGF